MLDLPIKTTVSVNIAKEVTAQTTRVNGVYFDFNKTKAIAFISYGSGIPFVQASIEQWELSGTYYVSKILEVTTGKTIAEELLGKVSEIVAEINTDKAKKEALIKSGDLVIGKVGYIGLQLLR